MRITIKEKRSVQSKPINLEDLEPGMVIQFGIDKSPIGLVISDGKGGNDIVLLCHYADDDNGWFQIAMGWKTMPIVKILGKLTEIVVESV